MKKILNCLVILVVVFLSNMITLKAEEITIDEVVNKFQEYLNIVDENKTVKLEENKMVIYQNEEKVMEYNYENNVISHNVTIEIEDPDSEEGFQQLLSAINIEMNDVYLINIIARLHGYSEREIRLFSQDDNMMENNDFDTYGYSFDINEESETKVVVDFKIDIQKFKLVINYNNAKAPELKFSNIKDSTIDIEAISDLEDAKENNALDEDGYVMVEVYRSQDKENFEYLFSVSAGEGSFIITDKYLLPNTTYYYKAVVENSNNFSEIYEVKTLEEATEEEIKDEEVKEEEKEEVVEEITINKLALTKTNEGIVVDIESNLSDGKMVSIYKSTDNEKYDLVAEVSILNQKISYLDELVKEGQTYYYKVVVLDNNNVINKVESIKYNKVDTVVENPQTGIINYLIPTTILLGGSFIGYKKLKRKNVLNKI